MDHLSPSPASSSEAGQSHDNHMTCKVLECHMSITILCREDYSHLYDFINTKNIRVKNKGKVGVT